MINILIVEDSPTEALLLKNIFESDKSIKVIGIACNGKEAVEMSSSLKPDLITMDINMPVMNGLEAIHIIMSTNPVPIVVVSSMLNDKEMNIAMQALESGAVTVIDKPQDILSPSFSIVKKRIISTIHSMSEIKVIRRRFFTKKNLKSAEIDTFQSQDQFELIAIGTSVGGPQALIKILSGLPYDFPIPIVIVQHMTTGFMAGFVRWLNLNIHLKVEIAEEGKVPKKGYVYFAPDDTHLEIHRTSTGLTMKLIDKPAVSGFRPSVTVLLKSVAKACGATAIGILLTGMGSDGAEGLLEIKKSKGHTLIQDAKSAVVFGMAAVAQSLGAVDKVLELDTFASYLMNLVSKEKSSGE